VPPPHPDSEPWQHRPLWHKCPTGHSPSATHAKPARVGTHSPLALRVLPGAHWVQAPEGLHSLHASEVAMAQHLPRTHMLDLQWALAVHSLPLGSIPTHAPSSPMKCPGPQAVQAPVPSHALHPEAVPGSQHRPPVHTPLRHWVCALQRLPGGCVASHRAATKV
jgi:hypothetical protein